MTKEQVISILSDGGVEASRQRLIASALLDAFVADKKAAIEEATKTATESAKAQFKDFVSKEEYEKILAENGALKDAGAKSERIAKYKALGLKDKYADLADSKLKDSKDLEKDLEEFKKANEELFEAKVVEEKPSAPKEEETNMVQVGDTKTTKPHQEVPQDLAGAIAQHYGIN